MLNPKNIGPNEEQFEYFSFGGKRRCQYDYRDFDGELFSCVRNTLDDCIRARNEWLDKR